MQEQKNEYWSRRKSTITVKFVIKIVYRTSRASNFPSWYLWRKLYENPGLTYSESFLAARTHCGKLFLETNQIHGFSQTFSRGRDFWTSFVCSRIRIKPWIDVKEWISSLSGIVICVVTNSLTHVPQTPEHVRKNNPILADRGPIISTWRRGWVNWGEVAWSELRLRDARIYFAWRQDILQDLGRALWLQDTGL